MSSITLHGAVEEIGGNKILIEDGATKLFFDFGLSFGKYGNYFSPYLQPRRYSIISDYMNLGLLPNLTGLYRQDYEKRFRETSPEPKYDGVILSHPHLDHAGFLQDVKQFCKFLRNLPMVFINTPELRNLSKLGKVNVMQQKKSKTELHLFQEKLISSNPALRLMI